MMREQRGPALAAVVLVTGFLVAAVACGRRDTTERPTGAAKPGEAAPNAEKFRGPAAAPATPAPAPAAAPVTPPEGEPFARFAGVLPCADCEAIHADLTLYRGPEEYLLVETYFSTPDGDRPFRKRGPWTTARGTAADPSATLYQLDPGRDDARSFLLVDKDHIRLLDRQGREIRTGINVTLERISLTAPAETPHP